MQMFLCVSGRRLPLQRDSMPSVFVCFSPVGKMSMCLKFTGARQRHAVSLWSLLSKKNKQECAFVCVWKARV